MADWLDSPWYAILGYGVIVVIAASIWRLEWRCDVANSEVGSPVFWLAVAGLALSMGVGRVLGVGGLVAELGRRQAGSAGLYDERRGLQLILIGAFAAVSVVITRIGISRWRRAGHLLVGLLMSTLVFVSVVRVVSLHQIDSWMRTNEAADVTFGTVLELGLLAAVIAVAFRQLRRLVRPASLDV